MFFLPLYFFSNSLKVLPSIHFIYLSLYISSWAKFYLPQLLQLVSWSCFPHFFLIDSQASIYSVDSLLSLRPRYPVFLPQSAPETLTTNSLKSLHVMQSINLFILSYTHISNLPASGISTVTILGLFPVHSILEDCFEKLFF